MDPRDDVTPPHSRGHRDPPPPAPAHGGAPAVPVGGPVQGASESAVIRGRPKQYLPPEFLELSAAAEARRRSPGRTKNLETPPSSSSSSFTPHVIFVPSGEDIVSKVGDLSRRGSVCVLSATGAVANASLSLDVTRSCTETLARDGCSEILSLSGLFVAASKGDGGCRSGGLAVLLMSSGGKLFGGCVGERMEAASPVQIVIVSFVAEEEEKNAAGSSNPPLLPCLPPPAAKNDGGGCGAPEGTHLSCDGLIGSASSKEKDDGSGGAPEGTHLSGDGLIGTSSSSEKNNGGDGAAEGTHLSGDVLIGSSSSSREKDDGGWDAPEGTHLSGDGAPEESHLFVDDFSWFFII